MYADYHLHSEFSDDSFTPMEQQIEKGIELGLDEMCFTDHVDYGIKRDWNDPRGIRTQISTEHGMTYKQYIANVNYPEYFAKLDRMRVIYSDQITIKKGLEFGIQSITVAPFKRLYDKYSDQLDFVLFSMHQVDNKEFWTQDFQRGKTQQEYNEDYYKEIYKTMKMFKDYSVLAHLDLIARYDENGIYPFEKVEDMVAEILKQAIADAKGIEINTSSWYYGLKDTQPSRAILKLYKDLGGKILTIGSDAHDPTHLNQHHDDAVDILKNEIGFKEACTFEHMMPIFYEL